MTDALITLAIIAACILVGFIFPLGGPPIWRREERRAAAHARAAEDAEARRHRSGPL